MRDYSKVGPKFWIGATGKLLRAAGMEAQIVSMYLLTSPHANMLGLYYCPIMFIAHETGLPLEGASKGLQSAIEAGFCEYDDASEIVWVIEMASYQVGESLKANDLRVKGVQNEYSSLPENPFLSRFYEKYSVAFCMTECRKSTRGFEGASKGLRSQEQEQEQEQEKEKPLHDAGASVRSASIPDGFEKFWSAWPNTGRKQAKAKCLDRWKRQRLESVADEILADVERKKRTENWISGFEPAPLRYLSERRWEDGEAYEAAYSAEEKAVFDAYNAVLTEAGWPEALDTPYSSERAASIRLFLTFSERENWVESYLNFLRDALKGKAGYGFDWVIQKSTFLRAREGNFAVLEEAA